MIKEEYVSVEVAELLEEKGFYGQCHKFVEIEDMTYGEKWNSKSQKTLSIPTQQMVMRWLREKFNIIINISFSPIDGHYMYAVYIRKWIRPENRSLNTYEESVDAAIKYCMENLI